MKLIQIHYVLAIAEHLNFTTTAKKLHISQPALSSQIKLLEDELGFMLFKRDKRSVVLTRAGQIFVEEFNSLQNQIDQGLKKVKQQANLVTDTLSIGFPDAIDVDSFFPKLFSEFKEIRPKTQIELSRCSIKDLRTQLTNDSIDIVFSFSFDMDSFESIDFLTIEKRKPTLIMSSNHPLAYKTQLTIDDIKDEPFVCYDEKESSGALKVSLITCQKIGYKPKSLIYAKNSDSIISQVSFNQGITFMDKSICNNNNLVFHDILPQDLSFDIVGVWKKTNKKPSLTTFINVLKKNEAYE